MRRHLVSKKASDSELILRSIQRPDDFVAIFDRHSTAIHAYLVRRAGRQRAEDILGDVWLQAFRSRGSYNADWPDARPWLYGIARNTLRTHWRQRRRTIDLPRDESWDPWSVIDGQLDAVAEAELLKTAIAELAAEDREVLLLAAWEDLSPSEIAIMLGIPPGTVRWRLHRARSALRCAAGATTSTAITRIAATEGA